VTELRGLNPGLRIVARAHQRSELSDLFRAGADRVVYAEYEVGLEIVRHALLLSEVDADETHRLVETLRRSYYDTEASRNAPPS
jgi:voltage-gated potassium channel Kch